MRAPVPAARARRGQDRGMHIRFNPLILLVTLAAPSLSLVSCGTHNIEEALTQQTPMDCRESAKLFDWFSLQVKAASWNRDPGPGDDGTLTIVFTIQDTDVLPHALSNSGGGFLYSVEFSLKGDDGTLHAPTDTSGIVTNVHFGISRDKPEEGTLKFKVRRGNYFLIFARKFDGKPVAKYDFSCAMAIS
jgi:hypothetical protein